MSHAFTTRVVLTLGCLFVFTLSASAARKVRAILIPPADGTLQKATLFISGKATEIELPQRNFSPEIELPDGDLLVAILSKVPGPGEVVPTAAPTVSIPAAWERCILLFFPDPSNTVFPARVIPVNATTGGFPNGHTLIYNVSTAVIIGKFGEESITINPGKNAFLKPQVADYADYPVAIDCVFPGDTKPTSICRSSWQHYPDARQFLFITPAPGFKIPRAWGVLDRSEESSKKKER